MPLLMKRVAARLCALVVAASCLLGGGTLRAQQATTAPLAAAQPKANNAEFSAAAEQVLQQVSEITGLKLLTPVKKTLRSRDEIRAYVLREMDEEKNPAERYAEARSAEAFGLIPKGFALDDFMVDLLTEQIAGLYDPKTREFYIADWIPIDDQRMVMAHELTHALQDQHFQIEAWEKAARPNDDAELAREASNPRLMPSIASRLTDGLSVYSPSGGTVLNAPVGLKRRPSTLIWPPAGVSNSTVPSFFAVCEKRLARLNEACPCAGSVSVSVI